MTNKIAKFSQNNKRVKGFLSQSPALRAGRLEVGADRAARAVGEEFEAAVVTAAAEGTAAGDQEADTVVVGGLEVPPADDPARIDQGEVQEVDFGLHVELDGRSPGRRVLGAPGGVRHRPSV